MGHGAEAGDVFAQGGSFFVIESCGGEKGLPFFAGEGEVFCFDDAAHEAEAVGVEAGAGEADEDVALLNGGRVEEAGFFGGADGEAAEFDDAFWNHAGHFCGFAASEDAAAGFEVFDHASDAAGDFVFFETSDADVVEEQDGVGASGENVVDVHGDEVFACVFEEVVLEEEFDFGADAIAAGDDDRVFVGAEVVGGGEEAESAGELALFLGAFDELADVADEGCGFTDVNAGLFIGVAFCRMLLGLAG